eukprot:TRINITY_DN20185_c0_g1_i1.p1 TRINITY_DN20185_c0_g1~~TRINITY_DN20185_c0_g1_i1.p1  ORF type:complete len:1790 (+),score=415.75 TRINITY_DN20185_c0_g1_i1:2-5371(+)
MKVLAVVVLCVWCSVVLAVHEEALLELSARGDDVVVLTPGVKTALLVPSGKMLYAKVELPRAVTKNALVFELTSTNTIAYIKPNGKPSDSDINWRGQMEILPEQPGWCEGCTLWLGLTRTPGQKEYRHDVTVTLRPVPEVVDVDMPYKGTVAPNTYNYYALNLPVFTDDDIKISFRGNGATLYVQGNRLPTQDSFEFESTGDLVLHAEDKGYCFRCDLNIGIFAKDKPTSYELIVKRVRVVHDLVWNEKIKTTIRRDGPTVFKVDIPKRATQFRLLFKSTSSNSEFFVKSGSVPTWSPDGGFEGYDVSWRGSHTLAPGSQGYPASFPASLYIAVKRIANNDDYSHEMGVDVIPLPGAFDTGVPVKETVEPNVFSAYNYYALEQATGTEDDIKVSFKPQDDAVLVISPAHLPTKSEKQWETKGDLVIKAKDSGYCIRCTYYFAVYSPSQQQAAYEISTERIKVKRIVQSGKTMRVTVWKDGPKYFQLDIPKTVTQYGIEVQSTSTNTKFFMKTGALPDMNQGHDLSWKGSKVVNPGDTGYPSSLPAAVYFAVQRTSGSDDYAHDITFKLNPLPGAFDVGTYVKEKVEPGAFNYYALAIPDGTDDTIEISFKQPGGAVLVIGQTIPSLDDHAFKTDGDLVIHAGDQGYCIRCTYYLGVFGEASASDPVGYEILVKRTPVVHELKANEPVKMIIWRDGFRHFKVHMPKTYTKFTWNIQTSSSNTEYWITRDKMATIENSEAHAVGSNFRQSPDDSLWCQDCTIFFTARRVHGQDDYSNTITFVQGAIPLRPVDIPAEGEVIPNREVAAGKYLYYAYEMGATDLAVSFEITQRGGSKAVMFLQTGSATSFPSKDTYTWTAEDRIHLAPGNDNYCIRCKYILAVASNGPDAAKFDLKIDTEPTVIGLKNGESMDVTIRKGGMRYFKMDLPDSVTKYNLKITSASSNTQFWTRSGSLPSDESGAYDLTFKGSKAIHLDEQGYPTVPGTLFFALRRVAGQDDYKHTISVERVPVPDPALEGKPITETVQPSDINYYAIQMDGTPTNVKIKLNRGSGVKLLVSPRLIPTSEKYAHESDQELLLEWGKPDTCTLCTYYVGVYNPTDAPITYEIEWTPDPVIVDLLSGVSVTENILAEGYRFFRVHVPKLTNPFKISVSLGSSNSEMWVRTKSLPSDSAFQWKMSRSDKFVIPSTDTELCTDCDYFFAFRRLPGQKAYSHSILISVDVQPTPLKMKEQISARALAKSFTYFEIRGSPVLRYFSPMEVKLTPQGRAPLVMYASVNKLPTIAEHTWEFKGLEMAITKDDENACFSSCTYDVAVHNPSEKDIDFDILLTFGKPSPDGLNCESSLDIVFVLDGSGSIGGQSFTVAMKGFVTEIISRFTISEFGVHTGLVQFGSDAVVNQPMTSDMNLFVKSLESMKQLGSGTNGGKGLKLAWEQFKTFGRPAIPNIVVVLTDGQDTQRSLEVAEKMKADGITIVVVDSGKSSNVEHMKKMATYPDLVFKVTDPVQLGDEVLKGLVVKTCEEADDPTHVGHPKFLLFRSQNCKYYWHLTAANGKIILQSQGYKSKYGAMKGIDSVKRNAPLLKQFKERKSKSQKQPHFFVLVAKNGRVIGRSETYTSKSGMKNGIRSVSKNAPKAWVDDQVPRGRCIPRPEPSPVPQEQDIVPDVQDWQQDDSNAQDDQQSQDASLCLQDPCCGSCQRERIQQQADGQPWMVDTDNSAGEDGQAQSPCDARCIVQDDPNQQLPQQCCVPFWFGFIAGQQQDVSDTSVIVDVQQQQIDQQVQQAMQQRPEQQQSE